MRVAAAEEFMQEIQVLQTKPDIVVALSGEIAAENADDFYAEIKALYSSLIQGRNAR